MTDGQKSVEQSLTSFKINRVLLGQESIAWIFFIVVYNGNDSSISGSNIFRIRSGRVSDRLPWKSLTILHFPWKFSDDVSIIFYLHQTQIWTFLYVKSCNTALTTMMYLLSRLSLTMTSSGLQKNENTKIKRNVASKQRTNRRLSVTQT